MPKPMLGPDSRRIPERKGRAGQDCSLGAPGHAPASQDPLPALSGVLQCQPFGSTRVLFALGWPHALITQKWGCPLCPSGTKEQEGRKGKRTLMDKDHNRGRERNRRLQDGEQCSSRQETHVLLALLPPLQPEGVMSENRLPSLDFLISRESHPPEGRSWLRMFFNIRYQNYLFCFNITIIQIKIYP